MAHTCRVCNGTSRQSCPRCGGTGRFNDGETCYYCNGNGTVTCNACGGTGRIED